MIPWNIFYFISKVILGMPRPTNVWPSGRSTSCHLGAKTTVEMDKYLLGRTDQGRMKVLVNRPKVEPGAMGLLVCTFYGA